MFLMTLFSAVRLRAALSPLSGFLSHLGLIALPLLSSEIHCSYEDIHHSCLNVCALKCSYGKGLYNV